MCVEYKTNPFSDLLKHEPSILYFSLGKADSPWVLLPGAEETIPVWPAISWLSFFSRVLFFSFWSLVIGEAAGRSLTGSIWLFAGTLLQLGREVKEEMTNWTQSEVFLGRLSKRLMIVEMLHISSFPGTKNGSGCEREFYSLHSDVHSDAP